MSRAVLAPILEGMVASPHASEPGARNSVVLGTSRAEDRLGPALFWLTGLVVLAGVTVRIAACRGDLWLDEIWTYEIAAELTSPFDVFGVRSWNNHVLNTLVFYVLGPDVEPVYYRIPALLAGLGTVGLAGLIGSELGRLEACLAVILTSCSYLLVHYSTEARGYSGALFFTLLGLVALLRYARRPNRLDAGFFWLAFALGTLSHLQFLQLYAVALPWTAWRALRRGQGRRAAFAELFHLHALPIGFLTTVYLVTLRNMEPGGGPPYELHEVLLETGGYLLGGPGDGVGALVASGLALALAVGSLPVEGTEESALRALLFGGFVFAPIAAVVSPPYLLFVRYFLVSATLFQLLLSVQLAAWIRSGGGARAAAIVLTLAIVAGNALHLSRLIRSGRGHYLEALRFIEEVSPPGEYSLGSDDDFRNGKLVRFNARYLESPARLRYVEEGSDSTGTDWVLLHALDAPLKPEPRIRDRFENDYELVRIFPYAALSGWHWLLYRRTAG